MGTVARVSCTGLFVLAFCGLGGLVRFSGTSVFLLGGEDCDKDFSDDNDVGDDGAGSSAGSIPAAASSASSMLRQLTSSDAFSELDAAGRSAPCALVLDAAGLTREGVPLVPGFCGIFEVFLADVLACDSKPGGGAFGGGIGVPFGFEDFASASANRTCTWERNSGCVYVRGGCCCCCGFGGGGSSRGGRFAAGGGG